MILKKNYDFAARNTALHSIKELFDIYSKAIMRVCVQTSCAHTSYQKYDPIVFNWGSIYKYNSISEHKMQA